MQCKPLNHQLRSIDLEWLCSEKDVKFIQVLKGRIQTAFLVGCLHFVRWKIGKLPTSGRKTLCIFAQKQGGHTGSDGSDKGWAMRSRLARLTFGSDKTDSLYAYYLVNAGNGLVRIVSHTARFEQFGMDDKLYYIVSCYIDIYYINGQCMYVCT